MAWVAFQYGSPFNSKPLQCVRSALRIVCSNKIPNFVVSSHPHSDCVQWKCTLKTCKLGSHLFGHRASHAFSKSACCAARFKMACNACWSSQLRDLGRGHKPSNHNHKDQGKERLGMHRNGIISKHGHGFWPPWIDLSFTGITQLISRNSSEKALETPHHVKSTSNWSTDPSSAAVGSPGSYSETSGQNSPTKRLAKVRKTHKFGDEKSWIPSASHPQSSCSSNKTGNLKSRCKLS